MEDKMNKQHDKLPRELRHLSNIGLDDFEMSYLVHLKKKQDISRKWKH